MRCLVLVLLMICPCTAQLDDVLTAFTKSLPQVHESVSFEAGKISPVWKPARLYDPPARKPANALPLFFPNTAPT